MEKDFDYKKGMELIEDDGSLRYVVEDRDGSPHVHLTGYDDFCMCESWYEDDEMVDRFKLTGKVVDISTLSEEHITECECECQCACHFISTIGCSCNCNK